VSAGTGAGAEAGTSTGAGASAGGGASDGAGRDASPRGARIRALSWPVLFRGGFLFVDSACVEAGSGSAGVPCSAAGTNVASADLRDFLGWIGVGMAPRIGAITVKTAPRVDGVETGSADGADVGEFPEAAGSICQSDAPSPDRGTAGS
jgi:hypothetical protein